MRRHVLIAIIVVVALVGPLQPASASTTSDPVTPCRTFRTTGKMLCGRFLTYWQQHNGLARFGYPVSNPFAETSAQDGKTRTVQYFQWGRLTAYPQSQPPHDVQVTWLRPGYFHRHYPQGEPDAPYVENLPRLPDAENIQIKYGNGTTEFNTTMTYLTAAKPNVVLTFYRDVLGKNRWRVFELEPGYLNFGWDTGYAGDGCTVARLDVRGEVTDSNLVKVTVSYLECG